MLGIYEVLVVTPVIKSETDGKKSYKRTLVLLSANPYEGIVVVEQTGRDVFFVIHEHELVVANFIGETDRDRDLWFTKGNLYDLTPLTPKELEFINKGMKAYRSQHPLLPD
jgi:hypothetical protein